MSDAELGRLVREAYGAALFIGAKNFAKMADIKRWDEQDTEQHANQIAICRKFEGQDEGIDRLLATVDGVAARKAKKSTALLNQPEALATVTELVSEAYRLGMRAGQAELTVTRDVNGMMDKTHHNPYYIYGIEGRN